MISGHLASVICEDAGALYQDTCEKSVQEVMESQRFRDFSKKIKLELPEISDVDIMKHLILVYSETIRPH